MRMLKSFSLVFRTLLALVVFSLTISITIASPRNCPDGRWHSISKKGTASTNSDNQLPYEERETEKDDEVQDNFSLVCLISEPVFLTPFKGQDTHCNKTSWPIDVITDIPLYLFQRTLLI